MSDALPSFLEIYQVVRIAHHHRSSLELVKVRVRAAFDSKHQFGTAHSPLSSAGTFERLTQAGSAVVEVKRRRFRQIIASEQI